MPKIVKELKRPEYRWTRDELVSAHQILVSRSLESPLDYKVVSDSRIESAINSWAIELEMPFTYQVDYPTWRKIFDRISTDEGSAKGSQVSDSDGGNLEWHTDASKVRLLYDKLVQNGICRPDGDPYSEIYAACERYQIAPPHEFKRGNELWKTLLKHHRESQKSS